MSRVIKSFSVKLNSPKLIEPDNLQVYPEQKEIIEEQNQTSEDEQLPEQDIEVIKDQASQILQETEQMVKELLETARQEAEKIIKNSQDESKKIVLEGQQKLKQIEEEAHTKGWQDGFEEGKNAANSECLGKIKEAENLLENAQNERIRLISGAEDEIVQLAVAVAGKIIGGELKTQPEIIVDIVKRAIQKATDREELTIRVSPENYDTAINALDNINQSAKGVKKLKILSDPNVAPGGCVVESPNETVDARVESQLNEIKQALVEVSPNA